MKLHHLFLNAVNAKGVVTVAFSVLCLLGPAAAQEQSFRVVDDHSTARMFIGTRENPTSANVAVARVSGNVNIDSANVEASTFNLKIYAADQNSASDSGNQQLAGDQPVISFQSQHVSERSDGTLQVDGKLTVTQLERTVENGTGEDYSGPVYGPARPVSSSHKASFIFTPLTAKSSEPDSPAGPADVRFLQAQQAQPGTMVLLAASVSVNGEAFPELLTSTKDVAWPPIVNNEKCTVPLTVGEDFSGPQCTGNVIEASGLPVVPVQADDGYSGLQMVPPQGTLVTIHLGLELAAAGGD